MNVPGHNYATIKNLHLITSIIVIVPIALSYGLFPNAILFKLFDIKVETINLSNIFRAMMGLYLASAALWIVGIVKSKFWTTATLTNIVFMGGLTFGRLLSLAIDGVPSIHFLIGLFLEVIFALWGVKNIKKYSSLISI